MTNQNILHTITQEVCIHYRTTPLQLNYASRKQPYAEARQSVWLIAKNLLGRGFKYSELGEYFNRCTRTAKKGVKSARKKYAEKQDFRKFVDDTEKAVMYAIKHE
jgi:chromosomal replication initiation ATPase DnaA